MVSTVLAPSADLLRAHLKVDEDIFSHKYSDIQESLDSLQACFTEVNPKTASCSATRTRCSSTRTNVCGCKRPSAT
jgi:hypothetical protein